MILDLKTIETILKERPSRALIAKAAKESAELRLHVNGDGIGTSLEIIKGLEDTILNDLRVKYGKSNRDLFARVTRPVDKVFSARGGSTYYLLPQENEAKARALSANIISGYSIKDFVRNVWRPHFLDDPNGLILLEILPPTEAAKAKQAGRSFVVPTYLPVKQVHEMKTNGSSLEYLFTELTSSQKREHSLDVNTTYFRVIDDAFDYIVEWSNDKARIVESLTLPNYFGTVPAIQCSDILHKTDPALKASILSDVIEVAKQALVTSSVKMTHQLLHGFPKYWEYADGCSHCNATGFKDGEECKSCKGTGRAPMTKVSDVKILTPPASKEDPVIAPNVAGYVSPDRVFWEIATAELADAEEKITFTLWGAGSKIKTTGTSIGNTGEAKTATEVMDDIKPQADRLHDISAQAEKVHKFILDHTIRLNLSRPTYPGALVNYGRRYMLEGPDALWIKYSDAKAKKAPVAALDDLYAEYLEAKFSSDPMKLAIQQKLTKVEPFFHSTASEVLALQIGDAEYKAKVYFGEWLAQQDEGLLLSASAELLRDSLYAYAGEKQLKAPEPVGPAI